MKASGARIMELARRHLEERYDFGARVPKNNPEWPGPWDCAEFVSWLVYQVSGRLYGCANNAADPAVADAYTGYWARDADRVGKKISIEEAARSPGAAVLRLAQGNAPGHIVLSDGGGGTVEAHSRIRGVIAHTLSGRRWDMGVLVPWIAYHPQEAAVAVAEPKKVIFRLMKPPMRGVPVKRIQTALKRAGFHPGPVDGLFGPMMQAAVVAFQTSRKLLPDGEVGPQTARALGVKLETAAPA